MYVLKRAPVTPGEILLEEFLIPYGHTQTELAQRLECDIKTINRIVRARQAVTAEMALKLGSYFRTTPDFWLNLQRDVDIYDARKRIVRLPTPVERLRTKIGKANVTARNTTGRRSRG